MHIAVCDDNVADRKQMERLLQRASDRRIHTTGVFYIDSYGNVEAVMRSPMLYDVFFIDMTTGSVNGFQLARKLIDAGVTAPIVLCISTIDYCAIIDAAIAEVPDDGVENSNHEILRRQLQTQIHFLQKDIKVAELDKMLDYAIDVKSKTIPTIELRGEKDTLYVYEDEILYAEKEGNYAHVVLTEARTVDLLGSVQNFYSQVTGFEHFIPISEKVLINIAHVTRFSLVKVVMRDKHSFTVSPFTVSALKKALDKYQSAN